MELMGNMRARHRTGRLWPPCKDTERWFAGAGESSMVPGLHDPGASVGCLWGRQLGVGSTWLCSITGKGVPHVSSAPVTTGSAHLGQDWVARGGSQQQWGGPRGGSLGLVRQVCPKQGAPLQRVVAACPGDGDTGSRGAKGGGLLLVPFPLPGVRAPSATRARLPDPLIPHLGFG